MFLSRIVGFQELLETLRTVQSAVAALDARLARLERAGVATRQQVGCVRSCQAHPLLESADHLCVFALFVCLFVCLFFSLPIRLILFFLT